jgi:hypothetical protein
MSNEYRAASRGTAAPFLPVPVALVAATFKTVLQVATPAGTDIRILGWGVSGDAANPAQPGWAQLVDTGAVGATGLTAMTPDTWGNTQAPVSLCVGGAGATGTGAGVTPTEGTITAVREFDATEVYPQSGYAVWLPDTAAGNQPRVAPSSFLRIRCQFPAAVNVLPWIVWAEPAV